MIPLTKEARERHQPVEDHGALLGRGGAAGGAGGRRRGKRVSPKLNKGLQDRLANAHQAFKKKLATAADSEGEEMHEEEEEEDVYVPNGTSRLPVVARKYSEGEQQDRGGIMGGDEAASEIDKAGGLEPMHAGSLGQQQLDHHAREGRYHLCNAKAFQPEQSRGLIKNA